MRTTFPKKLRLAKRHQFQRFQQSGSQFMGSFVIIDFLENQQEGTCLGITVTKRFGKSHDRNRFKRIVREAFRLSYPLLKKGFDLNIKPRAFAKKAHMQDIQKELIQWNSN